MSSRSHTDILPPLQAAQAQHSAAVCEALREAIRAHGGWVSFEEYVRVALYAPGLGYYTAGSAKLGRDGDFITAPELSGLFGRALARQCAQILQRIGGDVFELGAGSGALAASLLPALNELGALPGHYDILEVSGDLVARQQQRLASLPAHLRERVRWRATLPSEPMTGVCIANEVADALPFRLFVVGPRGFLERGVALSGSGDTPARMAGLATLPGTQAAEQADDGLMLADHPADAALEHELWDITAALVQPDAGPLPRGGLVLRDGLVPGSGAVPRGEPVPPEGRPRDWPPAAWPIGYRSELCPLLGPWIASIAAALGRGAVLLIDYGLSRREYYHRERTHGTLRCHFRHRAHDDPLLYPGMQDISAWVDFTRVAEAAAAAQLRVAGYCTQAAFLLANGIEADVAAAGDTVQRARLASEARQLLLPAEMGEHFKVMALTRGLDDMTLRGFGIQDLRRML